jgi:hypothetical protein
MKNMSQQRCTTPETHDSAMATRNGQNSLSLFFTNSNLGQSCLGRSWRLGADNLHAGARAAAILAIEQGARPQTISVPRRGARAFFLSLTVAIGSCWNSWSWWTVANPVRCQQALCPGDYLGCGARADQDFFLMTSDRICRAAA